MEKIKNNSASSAEISKYLADRGKQENPISDNEVLNQNINDQEAKVMVLDLIDLTLEKQDLIKSIESDKKNVDSEKYSNISQDEILKILDIDFSEIDFRKLNMEVSDKQNVSDSVVEAEKRLEEISKKIGVYLSNEKISETYQKVLQEKIETIRLARQVENMKKFVDKINLSNNLLLARRSSEDIKINKADIKVQDKNQEIVDKINEKISELLGVSEVYYEVNRRELLNYRNQYIKGGFIETPSEKEKVLEILGHLQLGMPVFLRGHLGAGKTETLLHISRKYFKAEPEFISGSEEATKYDIYGKTQIGTRSEEDRAKEFKLRLDEYKNLNSEASPEELKSIEKEFYTKIVVEGQTTSFFQYGPLVRAMKEGRPVIIDEIDAIPHPILIRLNHFLTRRVGDKVKVQENGGEEIIVKEGFCVMATGNIKGAKYKREDLDPAFLSRWWSREVDYLPQDETLKILVASLIDKRGNLELKEEADFNQLESLTKSAEEIQNIFAGKKIDVRGFGGDAATGASASLEKAVLSMRDLWNIVNFWKASNFKKSIDDCVYSEFIKKSTINKDTIYLVQLFCRFRFFQDWKAEDFKIAGLDDSKLEAFKATSQNN